MRSTISGNWSSCRPVTRRSPDERGRRVDLPQSWFDSAAQGAAMSAKGFLSRKRHWHRPKLPATRLAYDRSRKQVVATGGNIDYLIVSRDFPARLTGERNLERALRRMQMRYGCRVTAATLGQDGVLAWDGAQFHYSAAFRIEALDTTGAGDIFHAGFIYGLLQGWPVARQLDFACAAAALNCTAAGARGGIQSVENIEKLIATGARHRRAFDDVR